jgi:hypothetical protein
MYRALASGRLVGAIYGFLGMGLDLPRDSILLDQGGIN